MLYGQISRNEESEDPSLFWYPVRLWSSPSQRRR